MTHRFQHPGATPAGGEAAEQSEQDDGSAGRDQCVRSVGGTAGDQQRVGSQHELPPESHRQQDRTCHLRGRNQRSN